MWNGDNGEQQRHFSCRLMILRVETEAWIVHVHSIVTDFVDISSGAKRTPKQRLLSWQFWKKNKSKSKSNQVASKSEQGRKQRRYGEWIYDLDDPVSLAYNQNVLVDSQ
jgi:hypothetical protein